MNSSFKTGTRIFLALVPVFLAIHGSCTAPQRPRPSRIVLLTVNGLRADVVRYDSSSPLAALSADGVSFSRATTPSPQTFPAVVSVLSGRYPSHHGVPDDFANPIPPDVPLLGDVLARTEGWATAGYPAESQCHGESGLVRGFGYLALDAPAWTAATRTDSAMAFLDGHADSPAFVWIGFSVGPEAVTWERNLGVTLPDSSAYRSNLAEISRAVARIRDHVEADSGQTLLVVAGTHGEVVPGWPGDRVRERATLPGHGLTLNEDVLRVPLVAYWPGVWAPAAVDEPWVSTIDIAASLADLMGVSFEGDGMSLLPAIEGDDLSPRTVFHESATARLTGWTQGVAVRKGAVKVTRYGRETWAESLEGDASIPDEGERDRLLDAITGQFGPPDTLLDPFRPAAIQRIFEIRTLNLDGDRPAARVAFEQLAETDPRNGLVQTQRALFYAVGRNERRAATILDELLAQRPDLVEAESAYSDHLLQFREYEVAITRLEARPPMPMFELERRWALAAFNLVEEHLESADHYAEQAALLGPPPGAKWKRFAELAPEIEEHMLGITLGPEDPTHHLALGRLLGELELFDDCHRRIHAARGLDANDPEPEYWLGYYLLREGRGRHAAVAFRRAIERDPEHAPSLVALAYYQIATGERDAALANLEAAVATGEAPPDAYYNHACLLSLAGEGERAIDQLEMALRKGYRNLDALRHDPDLDPVRDHPRFDAAVSPYLTEPTGSR